MPHFTQGRYRAVITGAAIAKAKTGTDQLVLEIDLISFNNRGEWVEPVATRFAPQIYLSLTTATIGKPDSPGWVARDLSAIGFDGDFEHITQLEGTDVEVICTHEPDLQGALQDRWALITARPQAQPSPPNELQRLNQLYRPTFTQLAKTQPPPMVAKTRSPNDYGDVKVPKDNIPF